MRTTTATVTVLENEREAKDYLLSLGVPGPTLHPHVDSLDPWKRWNGCNHAQASGIDAQGRVVVIESRHYASGRTDYSTSVNNGTGCLSTLAFYDFAWPIQVFPAIANIRHPEHTPEVNHA